MSRYGAKSGRTGREGTAVKSLQPPQHNNQLSLTWCGGNQVLHVNSGTPYSRGFGLPGVPRELRVGSFGDAGVSRTCKAGFERPGTAPGRRRSGGTGLEGSVVVAAP